MRNFVSKRLVGTVLVGLALTVGVAACSDDADVASKNLSKDADNFKIQRRIVFYNGITNDYILEITGLCSVEKDAAKQQLAVTCKTGPDTFKKDFLGISDNVTWFAEQTDGTSVSTDQYKVTFKPTEVVPAIQVR